jgi:hypothetical protein
VEDGLLYDSREISDGKIPVSQRSVMNHPKAARLVSCEEEMIELE